MSPRAVIFDVDGVLVDSYWAHYESWRLTAARHGWDFTEDDFRGTFGRTSVDIVRQLWPHAPLELSQIHALDADKEDAYRDLVEHDFPAMPGARDLLRELHAAGFRLAVGSSGPPENVALALRHVDPENLVSAVVTGADVTRGKPDPQVFQLAAERMGLPPESCVVVEDAPAGVTAAHRAGMKCIALVSTGRTRDELCEADLRVDYLAELAIPALWELVAPKEKLGCRDSNPN